MNTGWKWFLYGIYAAALMVFFTWYLFPEDEIKKYLVNRFENAKPGYGLSIASVRPVFPPGLQVRGISISNAGNELFRADQARVKPRMVSLLSDPAFLVDVETYEGNVKARVVIPKADGKGGVEMTADLKGIQIRGMEDLQKRSKYKFSGLLAGNVMYKGDGKTGNGEANLVFSEFKIETDTPFFNLEQLLFSAVQAKLSLKAPGELQIKECVMKGGQAEGNLSGSISMKSPMEKSLLNITGSVKPHPTLMAKLGNLVSMVLKKKGGQDDFPFKISGTLDQPNFSLQ
jgi:type II secretion system protein N